MQDIELTQVRVQAVLITPLRVLSLFAMIFVAIIIILNAD